LTNSNPNARHDDGVVGGSEADVAGGGNGGGAAFNMNLGEDHRHVVPDRLLAEDIWAAFDRVGQSTGHEVKDLPLARGKVGGRRCGAAGPWRGWERLQNPTNLGDRVLCEPAELARLPAKVSRESQALRREPRPTAPSHWDVFSTGVPPGGYTDTR
jgi:hypothetical protein